MSILSILSLLTLAAATAAPAVVPTAPVVVPTSIPLSVPPITIHTLTIADRLPWLVHAIEILFLVATVSIIGLMSVQTTKTEGLSGSIGGRTESAYHGRLGFEQQLTRLTIVSAVAWIVLAIAYFWVTSH